MIKIGEYAFEVPGPDAMTTFALQQRIIPVAGRLVGVLMGTLGKAADFDLTRLGEIDVMTVLPIALPALGDVFSAMPPGELENLTRSLLSDATVSGWGGAKNVRLFDGQGGAFNGVMKGHVLWTWQLLWHALGVWYPDFFALAAKSKGGAEKENRSET